MVFQLFITIMLAIQPTGPCREGAVAQTATHPDGRTKIIVDSRSKGGLPIYNTPIDAGRPLTAAETRLIQLEKELIAGVDRMPFFDREPYNSRIKFSAGFKNEFEEWRYLRVEVANDRGLRLGDKSVKFRINIGQAKLFYRAFTDINGQPDDQWLEIVGRNGFVQFETPLLAPGSYHYDFTIVYPSKRERQETVRFKDGETINLDWSK